jgi:ATP synthase I subunit
MDKNASSEAFYSGALARISNSMVALGLLSICMSWFLYGWRIAAGVACGCAIAYLNFYWLKQVVSALADRATETGKMQSTKGVVARFLLRYVLMALAAYVMFNVSAASLYGLFAGLFVPVAAIACEAAYEAYAALARGI